MTSASSPAEYVDRSPIGRCRAELDRLIVIPAAHLQAYGVAWSLAVLRCTTADEEIAEAKKRVELI